MATDEPKRPGRKPKAETPVVSPPPAKPHRLHRPFAFWEDGVLREWQAGPVHHDHVELLKAMGAPIHEVE